MSDYIEPIKTAVIIFPLLAFLFTLPYMLYQYRKYGSVNKLRTLIIYSLILYLTAAYFLVILPLPSFEEVANLTTPSYQLIPFTFITDFLSHTSLVITDVTTYLEALKEPYIYQVLYNVILLLPLGIYLRYYFKCSMTKTICITFLVSLFFELTQLTGLYFIYPRSYRLFDIDDLMLNTLGGFLGYILSPLFTFFLPSRERIDEKSYHAGKTVSFLRRTIAFMIDQFLILVILFILSPDFSYVYVLICIVYYMILPIFTKGYTIGKKFLKMRITDESGDICKWYQYTIRYGLLATFTLLIPSIITYALLYFRVQNYPYMIYLLVILLSMLYFIWLFIKLMIVIFTNKPLNYEKISKTKNSSIIRTKGRK